MGNSVRLDQAYMDRSETAPASVAERNAFWIRMIGVQITLWTTVSVLAGLYWGFQIYQFKAAQQHQVCADMQHSLHHLSNTDLVSMGCSPN
jgi:hypothetical protein